MRIIEDELLASYMELYPALPDADWLGFSRLSLLAALESCPDPAYSLDLLWSSDGLFTGLTPEALLEEPDEARLADKLMAIRDALLRMPVERAMDYLAQLRSALPSKIMGLLGTDAYNLQPWTDDTNAMLDCLQELPHLEDDDSSALPETQPDDMGTVLQALYRISALGHLRDDDLLRKTWQALKNHLKGCPYCRGSLAANLTYVLVLKVLKEIMDDPVAAVSPRLGCLMRLYMALGMSPDSLGQVQELLAWVTGREVADV